MKLLSVALVISFAHSLDFMVYDLETKILDDNTIKYLTNSPTVKRWVQKGLLIRSLKLRGEFKKHISNIKQYKESYAQESLDYYIEKMNMKYIRLQGATIGGIINTNRTFAVAKFKKLEAHIKVMFAEGLIYDYKLEYADKLTRFYYNIIAIMMD
jgi:hypothetical protein